MKPGDQTQARRVLRKRWRRWTEIVELFARHRRGRKRVDSQEFAELHRDLLEICRTLTGAENHVEASFYRYLEDLIQPWFDLRVFARADRDILLDLLIRCRDVESQLGGRSWLRALPLRALTALLGALIFAIILLPMARHSLLLSTILDWARDWVDYFFYRVVHSSDLERLFAVGVVLIAISIYSVSRTARS
jgi:hypothetical protein